MFPIQAPSTSNSQCLFPFTRNSSNVQFERWHFPLCDYPNGADWMFWTFSTNFASSHSRRFDIKCTWIAWIKHKPNDSRREQMSVSLSTFNRKRFGGERHCFAIHHHKLYVALRLFRFSFAFNSLFRSTIYSLIRIGIAKLYSYNVLIVWERV